MKTRFTLEMLYKAVGMPRQTANVWRDRDLIPDPPFSDVDVVSLAIAVWLRSRGIGLDPVTKITAWIRRMSDAELQQHFDAGRTYLAFDFDHAEGQMTNPNGHYRGQSTDALLFVNLELARDRVMSRVAEVIQQVANRKAKRKERKAKKRKQYA